MTTAADPLRGVRSLFELTELLSRLYPRHAALLLIPTQGKAPTEREWNRRALERFEAATGRGAHLVSIARHLAAGGNVGLVVPSGYLVLDTDTPEVTEYVERLVPEAPRQDSRPGRAHFVVRVPEGVELRATTKLEIAPGIKIDLRVGGRSQIVSEPSTHAETGTLYRWVRPLGQGHVPPCPEEILRACVPAPAPSEAASHPGYAPAKGAEHWRALAAAGVAQGERHVTATAIAGGLLAAHESVEAVRDRVLHFAAQCRPPLDAREAERIVADIARRELNSGGTVRTGRARRESAPEPAARGRANGAAQDAAPEGVREWVEPEPLSTAAGVQGLSSEEARPPSERPAVRADLERAASPTSDVANALRLARAFGDELRWTPGLGWLAWDGRRWARSETRALGLAAQLGRLVHEEAAQASRRAAGTEGDEQRAKLGARAQALSKWARESEREPRVRAALSLARPHFELDETRLDADPWALNATNGVVDLRTGELRAHRAAELLTRLAPVTYQPAAPAERWHRFLERVLPEPEVRAFVQRAVGYSLTGKTGEQVLFLLWGGGANGKTTFVETLLALLGNYALRTPTDTLLARRESTIPNDVAQLRGARFAAAVETEEGRRLAEVRVKELTGGDTVSARFMRGEWFQFRPVCKLWLASNHRPQVRGTDEAIWRRIRLVPFTVTIPEPERDPQLVDRLRAELPGILAWAVQGCLDWQRGGLRAPEAVQVATADYRAAEDVLGAFLEECCALGDERLVARADLYAAYREWAGAAGEHPVPQKAFAGALRERGFEDDRIGRGRTRIWRGLDVKGTPGGADT